MLSESFLSFYKNGSYITEGGNVFGTTHPIKKEYIDSTLKEFYKQLIGIFPEADIHFKSIRTLGSVGKKPESGDIDLALSEDSFKNIDDWGLNRSEVKHLFDSFKKKSRTATDELLLKRAVIVAIAEKINESECDIVTDIKGSSAGSLFCQFPQFDDQGNKLETFVQIDINVGNLDWLSFAYHSATYSGNVKGLHRTQLLVSLFSHKGYTFSHNYGVKDRETQEIAASTPQEAIELLNKLYNIELTPDIAGDYFKLMNYLKYELSPEDLHAVYDTYLRILDSTRADIPEDLQEYWKEHQQRLGLKGKFLPNESNLAKYKTT
jgi:hypothetical protein